MKRFVIERELPKIGSAAGAAEPAPPPTGDA